MKSYYSQETERERAAATRRRKKIEDQEHAARKPPANDPIALAAHEAGGHLVRLSLKLPMGQNGGCGTHIHVVGTNGGTMPCGSMLTEFGKTAPYYCGHCSGSN